jgi:ABC-2 type transport system permease protein
MTTTLSPKAPVRRTPPRRPGAWTRARRAAADGWTMTGRNMRHLIRRPGEVGLYFMLPIIFVLVFGYVFGSGMQVPDGGAYREFLLPGVFIMTMAYGVAATATGIAMDARLGVMDRFRAMPMSRSALVVGRSLADLLRALLEIAVLVVCGLLVGWQWNGTLAEAGLAVALILLLRFALTWFGIFLGLTAGDPDLVGVIVFPTVFPLTALSNIFVAPELMPQWMAAVSEWNPLSATVAAARELFGNPGVGAGTTWASEHPIVLAVLWPLAIIAVFAPLAVRRFQRLSR